MKRKILSLVLCTSLLVGALPCKTIVNKGSISLNDSSIVFADDTTSGQAADDDRVYLLNEDFEGIEDGTTIASGGTPFSSIYNGTGDGNQRVIIAEQTDGTEGKVLQLQGASGWASECKFAFTPADKRYIVVESDVKFIDNIRYPGGMWFAASSASGYWTLGIAGISAGDKKLYGAKNDKSDDFGCGEVYELGQWYNLKVVLDDAANTYNLYMDGVRLNDEALTADSASPEWLDMCAGNLGINTAYYDNVKIYGTDIEPTEIIQKAKDGKAAIVRDGDTYIVAAVATAEQIEANSSIFINDSQGAVEGTQSGAVYSGIEVNGVTYTAERLGGDGVYAVEMTGVTSADVPNLKKLTTGLS